MKESKATLVFNNKGLLIALCCSANQLQNIMQLAQGNISKVCNGQTETLRGFYFRYESPLYHVSLEDIGTLKLEEYDKATNFQSKGFFKRSKARLLSRWGYSKKQGNNGF